jgi:hypothetical protein
MVNPQLEDYIKKQTAKGVAKDAIRAALVGVGWQEVAIDEALASSASAAPFSPAVSMPAASPAVTSPVSSYPATMSPTMSSPSSSFPAMTSPVSSSPAFDTQPVGGMNIDMPSSISSAPSTDFVSSPQVMSPTLSSPGESLYVTKKSKPIALIGVAVLALIFAGAAGYFWYQNQNLRTAASAAAAASAGAVTPVADTSGFQTQIVALTNDKDALTVKVNDLTNQVNNLSGQLSAFAMPLPGFPLEAAITVQGVLGGGGKNFYTVLTDKNILFNIKNSKDPRVVAILQPALTAPVIISGTHAIGSRDITATSINGTLLVAPTVATSTPAATPGLLPPAATSTKSP